MIVEARLVFDVPLRGSLLLLLGEGLLFILVSLSLGILISARTSSQRVAMMGALVGTMLPTMLLSGFIFPIESMPAPLQWVSQHRAGRWFVLIARGIMLKGVGLAYLWRETLILAGDGAACCSPRARASSRSGWNSHARASSSSRRPKSFTSCATARRWRRCSWCRSCSC